MAIIRNNSNYNNRIIIIIIINFLNPLFKVLSCQLEGCEFESQVYQSGCTRLVLLIIKAGDVISEKRVVQPGLPQGNQFAVADAQGRKICRLHNSCSHFQLVYFTIISQLLFELELLELFAFPIRTQALQDGVV
ncbi:hypothetical protein Q7C36_017373 [Tachysurus vachellii]|uniref:Uncharacterized protein n=1 Tax=Tachysurus vachellii TaxID=175792 RepID=A0AA88M2T5_TACVA|nr:hypothetical protein Q7C36_017373 [Tachysurus vachellii]